MAKSHKKSKFINKSYAIQKKVLSLHIIIARRKAADFAASVYATIKYKRDNNK
jgi:hypothetical protein